MCLHLNEIISGQPMFSFSEQFLLNTSFGLRNLSPPLLECHSAPGPILINNGIPTFAPPDLCPTEHMPPPEKNKRRLRYNNITQGRTVA